MARTRFSLRPLMTSESVKRPWGRRRDFFAGEGGGVALGPAVDLVSFRHCVGLQTISFEPSK